ncbi:hypothetical protein AGABI2DRAFT_188751 [Agaricus bisporus var. bisporus H97]|uniref:hypothetical protein n=1 Tax=Agaricus bisporus var. bisporus (strain H97 / ATCC MYA-4626 / FGSC 10389) TaxID=936046 RepID=UPI00029F69FA|nr:hypothetical protein AGABI2DRAFT_188751 [Agaricus bisporus var. bisporus H97]EKV42133.1 hypothetical protein AGABI2DRAFT_188751 [Agaricus bisporus var. bisporus H97]
MAHLTFYEPFFDLEQLVKPFGISRLNTNSVIPSSGVLKPKLDLHEDTQKNLITATFELPGVKKEDVQLDIHNGILIISAENKASSEHEENGYAIRERRFGKMSRSLRLPQGIKDEDIRAAMADGVLTITFPKLSPDQEPKKIAIA